MPAAQFIMAATVLCGSFASAAHFIAPGIAFTAREVFSPLCNIWYSIEIMLRFVRG